MVPLQLLTEKYNPALKVFRELIKTPVVNCFDGYPVLLRMALVAARETGDSNLHREIRSLLEENTSIQTIRVNTDYQIIIEYLDSISAGMYL